MPSYTLTDTHFEIQTDERLIKVSFPRERWEFYQNKYHFTNLDEVSLETRQSIFLHSFRDFRMGELSIEDVSAVSYRLREHLGDDSSGQILDDVLAKCMQFAYLVRIIPKDVTEAKVFNLNYHDAFDYFKKYGTSEISDFEDVCAKQNKITIRGRRLYAEFFQELKDQNKDFVFEQQQKGVLLLIRDFLSGRICTDELCGAMPAMTWERVSQPKNEQEQKLESIVSQLGEATFYIRNFGYSSAFSGAIKYYEEHSAKIASVSDNKLESESYNSAKTVTIAHSPVPNLEKFLFGDSKKIDV